MPTGVKLGSPWYHLDSCVSTNDEAQRLGRKGASEGTVVTAGAQSGGRGRFGRRWHSPPDENLYLSVLLRPPLPPPRAPLLCLCAGLALYALAKELLATTEAQLLLKWPNDLLGARPGEPYRKLGGILTELVCAGSAIDFVVVGIGCNLLSRQFPPELAATSLSLLAASDGPGSPPTQAAPGGGEVGFSPRAVAERLLGFLASDYALYLQEGAAPILARFGQAAGFGQTQKEVVVHAALGTGGDTIVKGVPIGLGQDGELLLRTPEGPVVRVLSGDLVFTPESGHARS